jgi:hypothetical protein
MTCGTKDRLGWEVATPRWRTSVEGSLSPLHFPVRGSPVGPGTTFRAGVERWPNPPVVRHRGQARSPVYETVAYELDFHPTLEPGFGPWVESPAVAELATRRAGVMQCEKSTIRRLCSGPIAAGWLSATTARRTENPPRRSASTLPWRRVRWHSSCTRTIASAVPFPFAEAFEQVLTSTTVVSSWSSVSSARLLRHRTDSGASPSLTVYGENRRGERRAVVLGPWGS